MLIGWNDATFIQYILNRANLPSFLYQVHCLKKVRILLIGWLGCRSVKTIEVKVKRKPYQSSSGFCVSIPSGAIRTIFKIKKSCTVVFNKLYPVIHSSVLALLAYLGKNINTVLLAGVALLPLLWNCVMGSLICHVNCSLN